MAVTKLGVTQMLNLKKLVMAGAAILTAAVSAQAQPTTYTWTRGNNNDNWNEAGNWNVGGTFPDGVNDVALFTNSVTVSFNPSTIPASIEAIQVNAGSSVTLNEDVTFTTLTVAGSLEIASGTKMTLADAGVAGSASVSGTLTIEGTLSLEDGIDVAGNGNLINNGILQAIEGICGLGSSLNLSDTNTSEWLAYVASNVRLEFNRSHTGASALSGTFKVDHGAKMRFASNVDIETSGGFKDAFITLPMINAGCGNVDFPSSPSSFDWAGGGTPNCSS